MWCKLYGLRDNMIIQIIRSLPAVRITIIFDVHVNESGSQSCKHIFPAVLIHTETCSLIAKWRLNNNTWFCFHIISHCTCVVMSQQYSHFTNFFAPNIGKSAAQYVSEFVPLYLVGLDQREYAVVLCVFAFCWITCQIYKVLHIFKTKFI